MFFLSYVQQTYARKTDTRDYELPFLSSLKEKIEMSVSTEIFTEIYCISYGPFKLLLSKQYSL